jgi:hypothetical protein
MAADGKDLSQIAAKYREIGGTPESFRTAVISGLRSRSMTSMQREVNPRSRQGKMQINRMNEQGAQY